MHVYVTGGTGFIGSELITELLRRGDRVVALVRNEKQAERMRTLGVQPVIGDVLYTSTELSPGMRGCDTVIHLAGENKWGLYDPEPMVRTNVIGTRNVARAAVRANVCRFVFVSSAATIGEESGTLGTEETVYRGWNLSAYEATKRVAEEWLRSLDLQKIEVVIVNPSSVQGPGRVSGTGKILLAVLNGLPVFVKTRFSICHIDDCVNGIILAAERGVPGERYILTTANVTTEEILAELRDITGLPLRPWNVPHWLALAGAWIAQWIAWLQGKDPSMSVEKMRGILHGYRFSALKSEIGLGMKYTPLHDALRQTVLWYQENGLIKRPMPKLPPRSQDPA